MGELTRILDMPEDDRPREKLTRLGPQYLSDAELLAIFFRTGGHGFNAVEMAKSLIKTFGNLHSLSRKSVVELRQVKGIGAAKASELLAVFEMARRLARQRLAEVRLDQPELVYELLAPEMTQLNKESLRVVLLTTRYRLIKIEEISLGSLNESVAHPREILRPAIIHSCYAFILVHNHPSGDPMPSRADRQLTLRLQDAANIFQIEMLDHIIIGTPGEDHPSYYSFRESGLI